MPGRKRRLNHEDDADDSDGPGSSKKLILEPVDDLHGKLLAYGEGDMGQLGLGENIKTRRKPAVVTFFNDIDIKLMACGGLHTCCVTKDDQVFTFGCNDEGALGRITADDAEESVPGLIDLDLAGVKVIKVSAGDSHSAILTSDGKVYAWGCFRDSHGKLGMFEENRICIKPNCFTESMILNREGAEEKRVSDLKIRFTDIASGSDHLLMLSSFGNVYSVGNGEQGQLGTVSLSDCRKDTSGCACSKVERLFLTPNIVGFSKTRRRPVIKKIFCGLYSSFAITNDGRVFSWGLNSYGQLGVPESELESSPMHSSVLSKMNIKTISGAHYHTVVLTKEGSVYTLGRGDDGRLGVGSSVERSYEPLKVDVLENVIGIGTGDNVSFAISDNGSCYGWGFGSNLQLTNSKKDEDGEWEASDEWHPLKLSGAKIEDEFVKQVDAGGQHVCLLI